MEKVLLTEKIHPEAEALLRSHFEVVQGTGTANVAKQLAGCDGVLVRSAYITRDDMKQNPQLKIIAKHGMGLDAIDVDAATEYGVAVVNAPFSNLNAVAEHIVALLISLSKRIVRMDKLTRQNEFARRNTYQTKELRGSTVGIIGLGWISRMVVKKLSGFELNMIASDPFINQADVDDLPIRMVDSDEVYRTSDFVIVHTSLVPGTFHLVGEAEFKRMKPSAYIINASRGPVVDEAAMIAALREGKIAGAGLDVFEQEPPAANNPLLTMENVILSPHNAALSDGALLAMAMDSAQGIVDYLEGRKPMYPCNSPK